MAVESERLPLEEGTWALPHGSWLEAYDGAVTVHLTRSEGGDALRCYTEGLEAAQKLLKSWGLDPEALVNVGFDEDGDLFEVR